MQHCQSATVSGYIQQIHTRDVYIAPDVVRGRHTRALCFTVFPNQHFIKTTNNQMYLFHVRQVSMALTVRTTSTTAPITSVPMEEPVWMGSIPTTVSVLQSGLVRHFHVQLFMCD